MECDFENCGYYIDDECTICGMGTDGEDTFCKYCKDNPNCYYKQLSKLKAENERLKEELTELEEKFLTLNGKSYSYYLTLQEIKDYLSTLSGIDNDFVNTETYLRILDLITKAESEEE